LGAAIHVLLMTKPSIAFVEPCGADGWCTIIVLGKYKKWYMINHMYIYMYIWVNYKDNDSSG
jgi:hypothetical protein